jgi:hypothetical protein
MAVVAQNADRWGKDVTFFAHITSAENIIPE